MVGDQAEVIWMSTFHSMCVRILRRDADRIGIERNFTIIDPTDQKSVIKDVLKMKILIVKSLNLVCLSVRSVI